MKFGLRKSRARAASHSHESERVNENFLFSTWRFGRAVLPPFISLRLVFQPPSPTLEESTLPPFSRATSASPVFE